MLVPFQTAMPVLMALLMILTAWLLTERPVRRRVQPVVVTGLETVRLPQLGQTTQWILPGHWQHRKARRRAADTIPDLHSGDVPARVTRLL